MTTTQELAAELKNIDNQINAHLGLFTDRSARLAKTHTPAEVAAKVAWIEAELLALRTRRAELAGC